MRNIRYLALLLFALLTATACSDDDNGSGNNNKKGIRNTVVMYVSAENIWATKSSTTATLPK